MHTVTRRSQPNAIVVENSYRQSHRLGPKMSKPIRLMSIFVNLRSSNSLYIKYIKRKKKKYSIYYYINHINYHPRSFNKAIRYPGKNQNILCCFRNNYCDGRQSTTVFLFLSNAYRMFIFKSH